MRHLCHDSSGTRVISRGGDGWCVPNIPSHRADPSTHVTIRGSSGLRRVFRYAMFIYSCYLCYVLSLYPFTKRYAQPYFFSCLIRQWVVDSCCELLNGAWFLESKREWGGRGVKEKNKDAAIKDDVSPSVTVEPVVKEKQSSLVDTRKKVAYPVVANYVRNTWDNIVMAMPKITWEGHYTCNVRVEYEWKPPRCSSCKFFGHIHEDFPKNTGAGEKKTAKKPSQTSRGVSVGPKIGFKPHKEYRPVSKKPNASSSGNKKKGVEPTIEVSNSNLFDVFNSIDNDVEFGTNGETTNLVDNRATSSGSSFMNIDDNGEFASNTPIGEKIDKIKRKIYEGKLRLLDNDENSLVSTGIVESDSEVDVVFDKTANLRISTSGKNGSDTNSLLE
nr:hypothetical protein [Tanacetum cinerariifolium]